MTDNSIRPNGLTALQATPVIPSSPEILAVGGEPCSVPCGCMRAPVAPHTGVGRLAIPRTYRANSRTKRCWALIHEL